MSVPAPSAGMRIRPAALQDLDALVTIICEAMPMDPQWDYRYPLRKKFPEDHYGYTRLLIKAILEDQDCNVDVVTFPSPGLAEGDEVPAGLAVTAVLRVETSAPTADNGGLRRDINLEHTKAAQAALDSAKQEYFEPFGPHWVHLRSLAIRPDFQRRGAGAALCRRVLAKAREQKRSVTLFASPMGRPLYTSVGFTYVGTVDIQAEGEEEKKLSLGAMVFPYCN